MLPGTPSTSYAGTTPLPGTAPPLCPAWAPAWQRALPPKRARHAATVVAKAQHPATVSAKRRDRPQPRASSAVRLPALPATQLPACDEEREQQLAAEVALLRTKYAAAVQVNKDLGREQWEAAKRAKELQRALDTAAGERELAFLKGRLEGLATVVAGIAAERTAAAELRVRAESAEAAASGLQAQACELRSAAEAAEAECGTLRTLVASLEERLSVADAQITRLSALALGAASLPAHTREGLEGLTAARTRNERVSSAVTLRRNDSHACV